MKKLVDRFYLGVENFGKRKNIIRLLPVFLVAISLFGAFPSYDIAHSSEFAENWESVLVQTENPFVPQDYAPVSHAANISFRLAPALFGKALGITSITGYLVLQFIGLVFLFFLTTALFQRVVGDGPEFVLLSSSMAFVFTGNVLCSDYRGFFDVFAYTFMIVAMLSRLPLVIFASALLAFFTDERALIASSLIYLFFVIERDYSAQRAISIKDFLNLNSRMWALAISWIAYFSIRFALGYFVGLRTNVEGMMDFFLNHSLGNINSAPFGIWSGLEGFWVIVGVSHLCLVLQRRWSLLFIYSAVVLVVVLAALWTFDITRSMAYLTPAIFISCYVLYRSETPRVIRYVVLVSFILCLFPTYYAGGANTIMWLYPLPLQILRMLLM